MKKLIPLLAFSLLLLIPASTLPVFGLPTELTRDQNIPGCDPDMPPIDDTHELGTAPGFTLILDELITSAYIDDQGNPPCSPTKLPGVPGLPDLVVSITNTTPRAWTDLWYIADLSYIGPVPGNQFTNIDWTVIGSGPATPGVPPGVPAFKIDNVGMNTPLLSESMTPDLVFEVGETWTFVIQDWFFPSPPLFPGPELLGSAIWPSYPPDPTSTASIVAVPFEDPRDPMEEEIGGKIIPIESTSLILAGAQTFSWMIPVTLSVLGIGLFAISRKPPKNN